MSYATFTNRLWYAYAKRHEYLKCNYYLFVCLNKPHTDWMSFTSFCDPVNTSGKTIFLLVLLLSQHKRNGTIQSDTGNEMFVNFLSKKEKKNKWNLNGLAYLCVVTSNHFTVWNLLTHTICGFIWINGHIQYVTWMRCCVASLFCFGFFRLCCLLYLRFLRLQKIKYYCY